MDFWQQVYFGVDPSLPVDKVLEVCEPLDYVTHVVVEHQLVGARARRWVQLLGDEHPDPDTAFRAMARAATSVVIAARMKHGSWVARLVEARDGRVHVPTLWYSPDFYIGGPSSSPPEGQPDTLEAAVRTMANDEDARAIDGKTRWQVWGRADRGSKFTKEAGTRALRDQACALSWDEVADWAAEEDSPPDSDAADAPPAHLQHAAHGDYASAIALLEAGGPSADAHYHFNRGCYLAQLGRLDEALSALTEEVKNYPLEVDDIFSDGELAPLRADARFAEWVDTQLAGFPGCDEAMLRPVEDLDLKIRTANVLAQLGIDTLGELARRSTTDLLNTNIVDPRTLAEITKVLAAHGLQPGTSVANLKLALWRRERAGVARRG